MTEDRGMLQLKLTPDQQKQIQQATGKLTDTLAFNIMELEERIAPGWRTKS